MLNIVGGEGNKVLNSEVSEFFSRVVALRYNQFDWLLKHKLVKPALREGMCQNLTF